MKSFLTFCLFGLIGACGDPKPAPERAAQEPVRKIMIVQPRETQAGDFLAGQFAQRTQDWVSADKFIGRVMTYDPDNIQLQKQSMVLAMGAGETSRAVAMARQVLKIEPENQLALLFMALDDFSRQDYDSVLTHMKALPDGSIADMIRPVLSSWALAGQGIIDISGFTAASPLHAYHALMIGDYMGKLQNPDLYISRLLTNQHLDFYEAERIADILARHDIKDKALALYELIHKQQPGNISVVERMASLKKGQGIGVNSAYRRISSPEHGAGEALFDMARLLYREQSDDSALVFTRMALYLNPGLVEARLVLAGVMARNNKYAQAAEQFLSIDADKSIYAESQRQAAMMLEQAGRKDDAIALMEKLFAERRDIDALIIIGDIHRRAEDYPSAIATYNRAEQAIGEKTIPAKYWHLLYARGMAYERHHDMERADRDLRLAISYQPHHAHLLNYLGYSWVDRGENLEEAVQMIEKAVSLAPEDGYIMDSLGWAHYRKGEYAKAVTVLEQAVELVPYDSTISDHLGDAYWRVGRYREAQFEWRRALNTLEDDSKRPTIEAKLDHGLHAADQPAVKQATRENGKRAQ
jgi:tetratricopeptide (TPR) repeat protein